MHSFVVNMLFVLMFLTFTLIKVKAMISHIHFHLIANLTYFTVNDDRVVQYARVLTINYRLVDLNPIRDIQHIFYKFLRPSQNHHNGQMH